MRIVKIFFFFFAISQSLFSFRQYNVATDGAKTLSFARIISVPLTSSEAIYNNPAYLSQLAGHSFIYEFDTEFKFTGINLGYNFVFDFASMGFYYYHTNSLNRTHNEFRSFSISFNNLFRSSVDKINQVSLPGLSIRNLAFSQNYTVASRISLGYKLGVALGFENIGNNILFSLSPSFIFGTAWAPIKGWVLGLYFQSPLYFDWQIFGGIYQEWTPFILSIGQRLDISPNITFATEIEYQGWDFIFQKNLTGEEVIDKGKSYFDLGQNVLGKVGFYLHSESKEKLSEIKNKFQKKTKPINDKIFSLFNEINSLSSNSVLYQYDEENTKLKKEIISLNNSIRKIKYKSLNEEEKKKLSSFYKKKSSTSKKIKEIEKKEKELDVIFGVNEVLANYNEQKKNLFLTLTNLDKDIKNLLHNELNDEQKSILLNYEKDLKKKTSKRRENLNERRKLIKNERKFHNEVMKKHFNQENLSEVEQLHVSNELKIQKAKAKVKVLQKEKTKIRKDLNLLSIRGEFYFGHHPEVVYNNERGSYRIMGNLDLGLSFRPGGTDKMYFTVSATDKIILQLISIYPQNELSTQLKITASFHF